MITSTDSTLGIRILLALAVGVMLTFSSSIVYGQVQQELHKPQLQPSGQLGEVSQHVQGLQRVQSTSFNSQQGYWSHIATENTGDLPWGESTFYEYPRYWNYIFVDSKNRIFTDAGGLFVSNGSYWRKVTAHGTQLTNVREIIEDNTGNIWIGTSNGLFEFTSSLNFIQEHHIGNSNMKKNDVNTLLQADDGSIWVGHRWHDDGTGGGVTVLYDQVIDSLDGYTSDIIQRDNGDIWLTQSPDDAGNGGFIYVYRPSNDSSWIYDDMNSGLQHTDIDNFSKDSQGNIWMGLYQNGGVIKYDGSTFTLYDDSDGLPQSGALYTYAASDDDIYYGTSNSLMVYDGSSWSEVNNGNNKYPIDGVSMITEDRNGNLLFGASPGADLTGGGIHKYDGSNWEMMSNHTDGGLFSNVMFGADVDTDGNLWVSGFYGAAMYDGEDWTYFNEHDGMAGSYAWKLEATSDGGVWFGTTEGPTYFKGGQFTSYSAEASNFGSDFSEAVFEDSNGNVWFAAYDSSGVLKYDGSSFTHYSSENSNLIASPYYFAFGEDPNGNIYVASYDGVAKFDGTTWSEFNVDGNTGMPAIEMASDGDNNLWIDTYDPNLGGVLKKWDGSNWTTYTASDGYMGYTTHIEPADDGSIWLAGAGVQVVRNGSIFDMTPGGFNRTSYVITHDDQGQTWVGTYGDGLYKYDMSEALAIESITDYPDDQGKRVTVKAGGFFMDPYRIAEDEFNPTSWGIEIKNGATWETLNESSNLSGSGQISVNLPTTMPTGENLAEHKYELRVGVYNNGEALGYSDSQMAHALDNIAPAAVGGVSAQRGSNSVTLSWGSSSANDLNQYEVVPADNPGATPLATTNQNSVMLSDAQYSGIQKVAIRALDQNKNLGEASATAVATFPMDLAYNVEARWNLISLPLDADQADIDNLQSQIIEGTLYEFAGSYEETQILEPGKGYWAKFDADASYNVPGLPVADQTLNLEKGWNLISGIGASVDFSQIQDPDGVLINGTLSGFDGAYTQSNTLKPGAGYWVRASESGSVTLSVTGGGTSTSVQSKEQPLLAEAKEKLNTVTVRSSEGYENTLYFGKELPREVDPLSFSLPPKAPGNAFDARLAGEAMRYTEENSFRIELQKKEASEITVDLGLLKTHEYQEYIVEELKGGQVLVEHRLTSEDIITLENNQTSSIRLKPAGSQQASANIPDDFDLSPSYPNPFNPSTTIQYQLAEQAAVRVEVFDMVGRKVSTLLAGEQQEAGTHTIRFNASQLSSGMYFVRFKAGSFQEMQKITLIK